MSSPVTHLNRLRSRGSRSSFQLRSLCVIRKEEEDPFKNVYLIRLEIFECPWTLFPPSISNRIVFCVRGRLPHKVEHIQHFPCRLCFQNSSSFFFFVESSPVIYNWTKKLKRERHFVSCHHDVDQIVDCIFAAVFYNGEFHVILILSSHPILFR